MLRENAWWLGEVLVDPLQKLDKKMKMGREVVCQRVLFSYATRLRYFSIRIEGR